MIRRLAVVLLLAGARSAIAQDCSGPALQKALLERAAVDQGARKALQEAPTSRDAQDAALRTDADNTAFMRQVLAKCGWPRRSVVGEEAARAAWLLTQHADMDPQYQVLAAQQLKYAVFAKEADGNALALLVDRNRRLNDQPQVYGMQYFTTPDGTIEYYDIVNPAQLDARRKAIGLPPFTCAAMRTSRELKGASIRWPEGVLFRPAECGDAP